MASLTEPKSNGPAKTSWADDLEEDELPPPTETTDPATGIKTVVEWSLNEDDKKVKTTRRIKRTLVTTTVSQTVAERKAIPKFGAEKGKRAGPDRGTTTIGEGIKIKLSVGGAPKEEEKEKEAVKVPTGPRRIMCRLCQGDHFTASCPYKDTLGNVLGGDAADADVPDGPPPSVAAPSGGSGAPGKYVPIHQRAGGRGPGESMGKPNRDEMPTLRVTNLSEDVQEGDLWELFNRFGRIHRIYVGKDQETGLCKGFAFVSFEDRREAEKAMQKINGLPYDHLILGCAWSLPRGEREERK